MQRPVDNRFDAFVGAGHALYPPVRLAKAEVWPDATRIPG
jgi:hypothetical protein